MTQRRADRQHERQRDLDDHERVAEPRVAAAHRRPAARLPGDALHVHAAPPRSAGASPNSDRRRRRTASRKSERLPVERDLMGARNPGRRRRSAGSRCPSARPAMPSDAAGERRAAGSRRGTAAPAAGGPAPSAARVTTSRVRTVMRASSRLATLAQAAASTRRDRREQQPERAADRPDDGVGERHETHADARAGIAPARPDAGRAISEARPARPPARDAGLRDARSRSSRPRRSGPPGARAQRRQRHPDVGARLRHRAVHERCRRGTGTGTPPASRPGSCAGDRRA